MNPHPPFTPAEYARRIERLSRGVARKKLDALIVETGTNRLYLTGFPSSAGTLVVLPGDNPYFFTDFRYLEAARKQIQLATVRPSKAKKDPIQTLAKKLELKRVGFEGSMTTARFQSLKETLSDVETWTDAEALIHALRVRKSPAEQKILRRSVRLADEIYARTIQETRPGMTEWDIRRVLRGWNDRLDSENESFDCIVAAGSNASRCHHHPSRKVLRRGQPLLIDMGAILQGYHSDMTRTVFFGEPTKKMKEIYKIVLAAQKKAIAAIRAGRSCAQVDRAARNYIKRRGYDKYFGHGLGHGVGLQVHEAPWLNAKSKEILKPGMVLTVEPGIYLPRVGGVRIEDIVVVRREGCEVLTKTPKELTVLEA